MRLPALYAILNVEPEQDNQGKLLRLLKANCGLVQLRCKSEEVLVRQELVSELLELARSENPDCLVIVNDDPELARKCEADGVHLGQGDASPARAKEILGPDKLIGLSTHNLQQVRESARHPVDYLGFGPVFPSPSKQGHAPVTGLDALALACSSTRLPIVAIGGISAERTSAVFARGAEGCAMISTLDEQKDLVSLFEKCEAERETYAAPSALASPSTPS